MAYTKNTWADRTVTYPNRYILKNVSTEEEITVELTPSPGSILDAGTPVDAEHMNHIETGLEAAATRGDNTYTKTEVANLLAQKATKKGLKFYSLVNWVAVNTGEVDLSDSRKISDYEGLVVMWYRLSGSTWWLCRTEFIPSTA